MKKTRDAYTGVVVVAAGKGSRMNLDINKQYVEVAGKPVVARTIQAFEDCEAIDEIVIVVNKMDLLYCKQNVIDVYDFKKVKSLVAGGDERQKSVYNGLKEISENCDIVLIHDGARPFINEESILGSIEAAKEFGAAGVGVPVKDTIKVADEEGNIKETLNRSLLWAIQTPQTFRYPLVMEAHRKAEEEGFSGTDDSVLVERLGVKVKLVKGSYNNIKITTQEDLIAAEAIAESQEG